MPAKGSVAVALRMKEKQATRALRLALKTVPKGGYGPKRRRRRAVTYDDEVLSALKKVWATLDMPCGKRLAPYLETIVPVLEGFDERDLDEDTRDISSS